MADVQVGRGPLAGLNFIAVSVLVYAASAFASAASAGLFAFAVATAMAGDPVTGVLNASGSVTLIIGLLLAALAFALLVWGFSTLRNERRRLGEEIPWPFTRAQPLLEAGYAALVVWAILGTIALLAKGAFPLFIAPALVAGAVTAFLFMTAVLLCALGLATRPGPWLAWAAAALGSAGIIGETVFGLRFLGSINGDFDWITLGGFPLINWNLPFGMVVGIGSLLMWAAIRFVPTATRGAPSRRPAAPSRDPSP